VKKILLVLILESKLKTSIYYYFLKVNRKVKRDFFMRDFAVLNLSYKENLMPDQLFDKGSDYGQYNKKIALRVK
jgi:hypothetical protein